MTTLNETIQAMINGGNSTDDIRNVLDCIDATQSRIAELTAQRNAITAELATLTDVTEIETSNESIATLTGAIELERIELARLVAISSGRARGMTIGIEIEFIAPTGMSGFVTCLKERLENTSIRISSDTSGYHNNTATMWKLVRDGSVSGDGYPMEIVSPVLKGEKGLMDAVAIMDALNDCGATVNRSCGVHVHFGIERMTWTSVKRIIETYTYNQNLIASTLPASRRDDGGYTGGHANGRWARNIPMSRDNEISGVSLERFQSFGDEYTTADVVSFMGGDTSYRDNRYFHVNLLGAYARHKTIEFRALAGTLESEKLEMWVRFLHMIVKSAETNRNTNRSYSSLREMCRNLADKTDLNLTHADATPDGEWGRMVNAVKTGTDTNTETSAYRSRAKAQLAGKAISDWMSERAQQLA